MPKRGMGTGMTPTQALAAKRRANDKLRKKILIGRLLEWRDAGMQLDQIPALRVELEGSTMVYRDHGVTPDMYFACHGEVIPDIEVYRMGGRKHDPAPRVAPPVVSDEEFELRDDVHTYRQIHPEVSEEEARAIVKARRATALDDEMPRLNS